MVFERCLRETFYNLITLQGNIINEVKKITLSHWKIFHRYSKEMTGIVHGLRLLTEFKGGWWQNAP